MEVIESAASFHPASAINHENVDILGHKIRHSSTGNELGGEKEQSRRGIKLDIHRLFTAEKEQSNIEAFHQAPIEIIDQIKYSS